MDSYFSHEKLNLESLRTNVTMRNSLLSDHAVMFDLGGFAVGCSVSQFIAVLWNPLSKSPSNHDSLTVFNFLSCPWPTFECEVGVTEFIYYMSQNN